VELFFQGNADVLSLLKAGIYDLFLFSLEED